MSRERAAVAAAMRDQRDEIERELQNEQDLERAKDRAYWAPLRKELEELRHAHDDSAPAQTGTSTVLIGEGDADIEEFLERRRPNGAWKTERLAHGDLSRLLGQ